jgi:hypothetical protein
LSTDGEHVKPLKKRKLEDLEESSKLTFITKAHKKVDGSIHGPGEQKVYLDETCEDPN